MKTLELRKQLLLAESELNRAQLAGDIAVLTARARTVAERAQSIASLASAAAMLVAGLAAFQRRKPADAGVKPTWLRTILRSAGLVSTLWLALRSPGRAPND